MRDFLGFIGVYGLVTDWLGIVKNDFPPTPHDPTKPTKAGFVGFVGCVISILLKNQADPVS